MYTWMWLDSEFFAIMDSFDAAKQAAESEADGIVVWLRKGNTWLGYIEAEPMFLIEGEG
jgi:hypothetical protein